MSSDNCTVCSRCVMDTSDPHIQFDANGVCEYCRNFDETIKPNWDTSAGGAQALTQLADRIKADGQGKDFDCIIGLSGGLDSSYAAYVAKEKMGLRPLLFHVDAGWNTDQAVGNIEKLVDGLGLELFTEVINWEEMKDLQAAFLRSGIPDQDLPQDAAFFSGLYKFARQYKVKHHHGLQLLHRMLPGARRVGRLPGHRHAALQGHPPTVRQAPAGHLSTDRHPGLQAVLPEDPGHDGTSPAEHGALRQEGRRR